MDGFNGKTAVADPDPLVSVGLLWPLGSAWHLCQARYNGVAQASGEVSAEGVRT